MSSIEDNAFRQQMKQKILCLMNEGQWEAILNEYSLNPDYREPLLVWIKPSLDLLLFIEAELSRVNISKVTSIGCGCGFLEWLINQGTSLQVRGLEVNESWWKSRHSTPQHLTMEFTEPGVIPMLDRDSALLFSYFNSMDHFDHYMQNYSGSYIILIGPVDGKRHCEPEPGQLELNPLFKLVAQHDIRNMGEDRVAIYQKLN